MKRINIGISAHEMVAHMTECELATIADMLIKRHSKREMARHIGIAQDAVDWMVSRGLDDRQVSAGPRLTEVMRLENRSVVSWAGAMLRRWE